MRILIALWGIATLGVQVDPSKDAMDAVKYAHLKATIAAVDDPSNVRAELEAAVKIYSQDGDIWRRLGLARLLAKEYDPCIDAMKRALKLGGFSNKFQAFSMYRLACAYALKGDLSQGILWLEKSMNAGFRDLDRVRTDPDLAALHRDPAWEDLAATRDVTKMSRDEGFRYDLWLLDREVRRLHYNPYARFTKAEQDAWVKQLDADIPNMNDDQIEVAFMKYMRRMGDGHTFILPNFATPQFLPLNISWVAEGPTVVSATPSLKDLLGARITKIDGVPIDQVLSRLEEVALHDNTQSLRFYAPMYLGFSVLHGLGIAHDPNQVDLSVTDGAGATRNTVVRGGPPNPTSTGFVSLGYDSKTPVPLYLRNQSKPYWFEPIPELGAVYFRFGQVQDDPAESTARFASRMIAYIEEHHIDKLIVDVRTNGGGNAYLNIPIENAIIGCKTLQARGHLFVIIGKGTFSAAQVFVTDVGRACDPIFVGEATGSKPNFVGESNPLTLPYSRMQASIADLYFERSWPTDERTWIAPDLPAPPSLELLRANRDPALEAIAAYLRS